MASRPPACVGDLQRPRVFISKEFVGNINRTSRVQMSGDVFSVPVRVLLSLCTRNPIPKYHENWKNHRYWYVPTSSIPIRQRWAQLMLFDSMLCVSTEVEANWRPMHKGHIDLLSLTNPHVNIHIHSGHRESRSHRRSISVRPVYVLRLSRHVYPFDTVSLDHSIVWCISPVVLVEHLVKEKQKDLHNRGSSYRRTRKYIPSLLPSSTSTTSLSNSLGDVLITLCTVRKSTLNPSS